MTLMMSLILSCSVFVGFADNVPEVVKKALTEQYAGAELEEVLWSTEQDAYVASFNGDRDQLHKVYFSAEGKWLQTQLRLYPSQLPNRLYDYYEMNYFERDVTFLCKVLLPEQSVEYRIEWETLEAVHIERLNEYGQVLENKQIPFTEGFELW